jgi:cyclase
MVDVVRRTAEEVSIPFTVGGGIKSTEDMKRLLRAGADKIGINTAAIQRPDLITEGSRMFGAQCIVVAIDAKFNLEWQEWEVYTHGGRKPTGIRALAWAQEAERRGAGELLLTSMDADGTKDGFDLPLTRVVSDSVGIPVIASGGAGSVRHFAEILTMGHADAALAASIFHYKEVTIREVKDALRGEGVTVR